MDNNLLLKKLAIITSAAEMEDQTTVGLLLQGLFEDLNIPVGPDVRSIKAATETTEKAVVYGKDGYTDENDPRQPNARTHSTDSNGRVTAVWLTVHVDPKARFRCVNAFVKGEEEAKGQTIILISVRDKNGNAQNNQVIMATGYQGQAGPFDDYLTPGNAFYPVQHILADSHDGKGCTFIPPALGGIAIFVAKTGDIRVSDSDIVGNLGLPYARHVSYVLEFQER
jgi:hypothetical protein